MKDDEMYMRQALAEARKAEYEGEIPIGAVIVCKGRIIARAHNLTERLHDVTAHAEMQAITAAAEYLGKVSDRLHTVCHCGTLSDVCRRTGMVADKPRGVWCSRRQTRFPHLCTQHSAPQDRTPDRSARRGVQGSHAGFLPQEEVV